LMVLEKRMKKVQLLRWTDEQVLESFRGKVERVDGNAAHMTLVDSKGQEAFASYDAKKLELQGILESTRFTCTIKERNGKPVVMFEPIPRQPMSDEDWRRLCQEIQEKLGDDDPEDDY